jgi:hypothetical protein
MFLSLKPKRRLPARATKRRTSAGASTFAGVPITHSNFAKQRSQFAAFS